jgi:hypothetical protein
MTRRTAIVTLLFLVATMPAFTGERSFSGFVGFESRNFIDDAQFDGQLDGRQYSLIFSPELRYRTDGRRNYFAVVPFARVDSEDDERTHWDVREAYWRRVGKGWEVLAGLNRVFWGVTESHHLVDVINQTDFVEDLDGEQKLGQPMVAFALQRSWGRLEAFALPGFRERTFPGEAGRLRPSLVVDTGAALFESGAGNRRLDYALRYSHYFGDWDFGAYFFHGTGREPRLLIHPDGDRLIPFYDVTRQVGVDVQYTRNAWLWKLETMGREGQASTFGALVGGFEYTFYQAVGAADIGVLAEYLYDGRDPDAPLTTFDDDIFVGSRVALNNAQDTAVLFGVIVDANDGSIAGTLEAERRIGNHLFLELDARFFGNVADNNPLRFFKQDSYLGLRLSYNF